MDRNIKEDVLFFLAAAAPLKQAQLTKLCKEATREMKNGKEAATTCNTVGEKAQLAGLPLCICVVFLEPN